MKGGTTYRILEAMKDSRQKAFKSLAGYKFMMFGYHAARWVNYNHLLPDKHRKKSSPFKELVKVAYSTIFKEVNDERKQKQSNVEDKTIEGAPGRDGARPGKG